MLLGFAVDPAEQRYPQQSQRARDQEGGTPAARYVIYPIREERRNRAADRRSAVEQRNGPSALRTRKPLGDRLGGARPVCRLAGAQQESEDTQAFEPRRRGSQHSGHGIEPNRQG